MIRTYLLAQMWLVEELQNATIENIRRFYIAMGHGPDDLSLIFDNTTDADPLRRMAMERMALRIFNVGGWKAFKESTARTLY